MMDLGPNVKITEALAYASGSADRNGAILDMAGWDGVLILVHFAAIADAAVASIKAQSGAASNLSDAADLAGTAIVVGGTEDDKTHWIDIKPRERYVRLVVKNDAANATAQAADYIQYGSYGVDRPVVDADGKTLSQPAEGTA